MEATMAAYIVSYDLHKVGQNYTCINEKLTAYPTHWHIQGSVWLIKTSDSAAVIRDKLTKCLDTNDKLIVARLSGEAAWFGYSEAGTQWLKGLLEPA